MRVLPLFILALTIGCDSKAPGTPAPAIGRTLGVGDPAPALQVSQWQHGTPAAITEGKISVVFFWVERIQACRTAIPIIGALAKEYSPKGVDFIAVSSLDDQGNTADAVARYIQRTGKQYDLHYAWCETNTTFNTWMGAADIDKVPTVFVIDRQSKIAFIGHPYDLDEALPKIIAGTWRGRADLDAIAHTNARLVAIFDRVDRAGDAAEERLPADATPEVRDAARITATKLVAPEALKEYAAFLSEHPRKASNLDGMNHAMVLHLQLQHWDEAKALATTILATAKASDDMTTLLFVFKRWMSKLLNPERKHMNVAVDAVEAALPLFVAPDLGTVVAAAHANKLAGNMARYEALVAEARKLCANDPKLLGEVEERIKGFQ